MEPKLLTSFYGDGYLYRVYEGGETVRKLMTKPGFGWERVHGPRLSNGKIMVIEEREQRNG